LLAGCTDNPQNKAAKELREATDEAMAMAEKGIVLDASGEVLTDQLYAKARQRLNAALSKASTAGNEAAGSGYLAGGNLNFAQARCLRRQLHSHTIPVSGKIDQLSMMGRKLVNLQMQQERLEQMSAAADAEIAKLTELVEGATQQAGLKAELAASQAQLTQLQTEKADWLGKQQEAQNRASRIQKLADEKFQAAELAEGDDKATLQEAAFALRHSRKEPLSEAQDAEDHAVILQSRINTLGPAVDNLRGDIKRIIAKIDKMTNSLEREQLKTQADEVKNQIDSSNTRANTIVEDMKTAANAYSQKVAAITKLLDAAIADYGRIMSRSLRQTKNSRIAESNFWKASVGADEVYFRQNVGLRLDSIAAAAEGQLSTTLSATAEEFSKVDQERSKAINDAYDKTIAEYSESPGSGASAMDTASNHALALYGKMTFAERLGDYDTADAALNKADELLAKIKETNPAFLGSITARLVTGSNEFIPPMSVDMTEKYDDLRKEFTSWKSLRGDEAKVRVEELLVMLDNMKPPLDASEFDQERAAMKAALQKGFDQPDISASDPNYF
jgi:hypothetical protein